MTDTGRMKILFLATLSPDRPTIIGRTVPLAEELATHRHDVSIVTLGSSTPPSSNFSVRMSVVGPALRDTSARPSLPTILGRLRAGTRALKMAVRHAAADVVVLVKPHPQNVFALSETRARIILDADDDELWASRITPLERWFMRTVERRAVSRTHAVTACSPALVDHYMSLAGIRPVVLLPTGIRPSDTTVPNLRMMFQIPPDAPIILYIGSLSRSSGHRVDVLLETWDLMADRHHDARLVIAGDGIDAAELRQRAGRLTHGAHVHFLGGYAAEAAEGLARQATVLVDPVDDSPATRAKSSSRTLLALRTGVPIVTGDVGIRRLLLPLSLHRWALVPPSDTDRFLASLLYALTPEARRAFAETTRGRWEHWSWKNLGERFHHLLQQVAA